VPVGPLFDDRPAAGEVVAGLLARWANRSDVVVLGLARGGVPVAAPIARALGSPLEVMVARKLGVPGIEEVAFAAIAEGRRRPVRDAVASFVGVPRTVERMVLARERAELARRLHRYRAGRPLPEVRGKTCIVVDDGVSSGATLRAAAASLRSRRPARLIAAVPVASSGGVGSIAGWFDEVIAEATPEAFGTVSDWYARFEPVSDEDVLRLLAGERLAPTAQVTAEAVAGPTASDLSTERPVSVALRGEAGPLAGDLGLPIDHPSGLVIVVHGGGSSRRSYRNRYLAGRLRLAGWATLRIDLLTEPEQAADGETGCHRFEIDLLARRLDQVVGWALGEAVPGCHRLVLFGASTGAAAALEAAALGPRRVAAVVARGGRIDLAPRRALVRCPCLLVVGRNDREVAAMNRDLGRKLSRAKRVTIRGAGHVFEEPGTLGRAGEAVVRWLRSELGPRAGVFTPSALGRVTPP
jgi:putative phosphoribosyl transferase